MAIVTTKNTLPGNSGVALYDLKTFLVTKAGWTVIESSDGTTFAANNGDTITGGGTGAGGMGNANAWYRIRMPGSSKEIAIQRVNATTTTIRYAVVGFTNATGTATTLPTGTNTQDVVSVAAGNQNIYGTFNRVSYWADNAAPYGWGMHGWSAAGATTFAFAMDALLAGSYPAADQDPYVFWTQSNSALFGVASNFYSGSNIRCWFAYGNAGQAFTATCPAFSFTDNVAVVGLAAAGDFGTNLITGKDDNLALLYARRSALGAPTGYRGLSTYFQLTSTIRANLSTQTIVTPLDRLVIGNLSIPWGTDGVAPLL